MRRKLIPPPIICFFTPTSPLMATNILELSEQEIVRRGSLNELRNRGIEPYPAAEFPVTGYTDEIKANFSDDAPDAMSAWPDV